MIACCLCEGKDQLSQQKEILFSCSRYLCLFTTIFSTVDLVNKVYMPERPWCTVKDGVLANCKVDTKLVPVLVSFPLFSNISMLHSG